MTKEQINNLLLGGIFPEPTNSRELVETHISWVIICDHFVYKIKKPVQYSFLNFSTPALRKHFCQREIELNKRLTDEVYIEVLPVFEWQGSFKIGGHQGSITDYAVRMHKLDRNKQMDNLLMQNEVTNADIQRLAQKIALFHQSTTVIYDKYFLDVQEKFNDLESESEFLSTALGPESSLCIRHAIASSNNFIEKHKALLQSRLAAGYFRDCHGDLHSRNIFLLPAPLPFDCIEFNDDFRQIDVLNEVAFLCMDLDAFNRQDMSELFIDNYNRFFPAMKTNEDRSLFIFYKSYRANIRAKVNSLRARSATDGAEKKKTLALTSKYLLLMESYLKSPALI